MPRRALAVCAGLSLVWLGVAACGKPAAERPDAGKPPVSRAELDQGLQLCEENVARLCACAERDPAFVEPCELARGQPDALKLHRSLLEGAMGKLNDKERRGVEDEVRKVVRSCVQSMARACRSPG